ncbi:MAG: cysteine--tRNA ligase [Dehalococcoidia bacterium]|nr:cysteine--tRNA ligase [Dehalococcoidia bacterium]MQG15836.1 cysteine--tRNA ligase [SAR202 cluster bacterium]|tara:strand:- start:895 stop:2253 length:1359 start_codon:yes stop_codon:yes gene_type:complete
MKIHNTLTGKTELLKVSGNKVSMYVCGITPYSPAHVGHAMRSVVFDVFKRYLIHKGLDVVHVENFTDIDDKMIDGANKQGISVSELAESNISSYLTEMDMLGVLRADSYPRATGEIENIVNMISGLIENESAYEVNGDVYFRVRSNPDYGKLSDRDIEKLKSGARVAIADHKEDALDFALWKSQKPGEPAWQSPWGLGRPGWHIECSAMALEYLGESIDIHGGGQDLIFPHHENEIAQSESFSGHKPFAKVWMHNGLVRLGEDKMSKSLGNMVTIGQALNTHSADALRLLFISAHYRSPITYNEDAVLAQENAIQRIKNALKLMGQETDSKIDTNSYVNNFESAMDDDLNTPKALAVIFDLVREIYKHHRNGNSITDAQNTLKNITGVLGLTLSDKESNTASDSFIDLLIEVRLSLREANQYELADKIRDGLLDLGVHIEDGVDKTTWNRPS